MLQIDTNNSNRRKKVEIDGHEYIVRRLGAGEQLTINQLIRQAKKLESTTGKDPTDAQIDEAVKLTETMFDMFIALFDDGGDQSHSKALVNSLNEHELAELLKQIFSEDLNGTPEVS